MKHVRPLSRNHPAYAQNVGSKDVLPQLGFWDWWVLVTQVLIWIVNWFGSRS